MTNKPRWRPPDDRAMKLLRLAVIWAGILLVLLEIRR